MIKVACVGAGGWTLVEAQCLYVLNTVVRATLDHDQIMARGRVHSNAAHV